MSTAIFNIRVYGLYINESDKLLITDEYRLNMNMTKFPGGGLKFGESTRDGLKRECQEELHQEVEILDHFYTTDFFQESFSFPNRQLISIYYFIKPVGELKVEIVKNAFDYTQNVDGPQCFRFIPLSQITENDVSFPIDKKVVSLLKKYYSERKN